VSGADPDEALVRRAVGGEAGAFRELFERFGPHVLATARRIVGDAHDAEEILQEVFLKVHRRLGGFEFRSRFSLWLHKIAVHESLNWKRRRRPEPLAAEPPAAPPPEADPLTALLAPLSPPLRAVLVLRYGDGFSYEEIAELLDIPVGTVRSRVHEAHEKLRE
jgi:RNA polymerase sigma-70 factor (ECF subfamily)